MKSIRSLSYKLVSEWFAEEFDKDIMAYLSGPHKRGADPHMVSDEFETYKKLPVSQHPKTGDCPTSCLSGAQNEEGNMPNQTIGQNTTGESIERLRDASYLGTLAAIGMATTGLDPIQPDLIPYEDEVEISQEHVRVSDPGTHEVHLGTTSSFAIFMNNPRIDGDIITKENDYPRWGLRTGF